MTIESKNGLGLIEGIRNRFAPKGTGKRNPLAATDEPLGEAVKVSLSPEAAGGGQQAGNRVEESMRRYGEALRRAVGARKLGETAEAAGAPDGEAVRGAMLAIEQAAPSIQASRPPLVSLDLG